MDNIELENFINSIGSHPSWDEISKYGDIVYSYTKQWNKLRTDQYIVYYYKYHYYLIGMKYTLHHSREYAATYHTLHDADIPHSIGLDELSMPTAECIRFDQLTIEQVNILRRAWEMLI